jgi:hypothetical protein
VHTQPSNYLKNLNSRSNPSLDHSPPIDTIEPPHRARGGFNAGPRRPRPTFVCGGHLRCEWLTRYGSAPALVVGRKDSSLRMVEAISARMARHQRASATSLGSAAITDADPGATHSANEGYKLACRCSTLTCGTTDKLSTRSLSVTNSDALLAYERPLCAPEPVVPTDQASPMPRCEYWTILPFSARCKLLQDFGWNCKNAKDILSDSYVEIGAIGGHK